jgi:hypothetical protein
MGCLYKELWKELDGDKYTRKESMVKLEVFALTFLSFLFRWELHLF